MVFHGWTHSGSEVPDREPGLGETEGSRKGIPFFQSVSDVWISGILQARVSPVEAFSGGEADLQLAFLSVLSEKSSCLEQEEEIGMIVTGILSRVNKPPL